jgi:hypothetical protein
MALSKIKDFPRGLLDRVIECDTLLAIREDKGFDGSQCRKRVQRAAVYHRTQTMMIKSLNCRPRNGPGLS